MNAPGVKSGESRTIALSGRPPNTGNLGRAVRKARTDHEEQLLGTITIFNMYTLKKFLSF